MFKFFLFFLTLFSNVVTLTDLPFSSAQQDYKTPQIGKSVEGGSLCSQWFFFRKGIGTHANSKITYEIEGKFSFFDTSFGVDCEVLWFSSTNKVSFSIFGDEKLLFESEPMTPVSLPQHVRIPIKGVRELILVVEGDDDGLVYDHADWLDPKLIK